MNGRMIHAIGMPMNLLNDGNQNCPGIRVALSRHPLLLRFDLSRLFCFLFLFEFEAELFAFVHGR